MIFTWPDPKVPQIDKRWWPSHLPGVLRGHHIRLWPRRCATDFIAIEVETAFSSCHCDFFNVQQCNMRHAILYFEMEKGCGNWFYGHWGWDGFLIVSGAARCQDSMVWGHNMRDFRISLRTWHAHEIPMTFTSRGDSSAVSWQQTKQVFNCCECHHPCFLIDF